MPAAQAGRGLRRPSEKTIRRVSGLYDHDLATYTAADRFRHQDAEGFVRIFGLGIETWSSKQGPGRPGAVTGAGTGAGTVE